MITRGNDMYVQRGETFTIDRTVRNYDGSPYIVSNQYTNPYVLITVSSSKYDQPDRYIANWWLDLKELPRFNYTRPKEIVDFEAAYVIKDGDAEGEYLYYKVGEPTLCKYWVWDSNTSTIVWKDYDFRIIHTFTHTVTKDWIEQNYNYSVRLVSGMDMYIYMSHLYESVFNKLPDKDSTTEEMYLAIKNKNEDFVKDVVISRPIATFDVVQDLAAVSKIVVSADLNGGLK